MFSATFHSIFVALLILTANSSLAQKGCPAELTYDVNSKSAPDFFIRTGYSRDNDDPAEGHYETAIIDLTMHGKKSPTNKTVCLYLAVGTILSTEIANAQGWINQYFVRNQSAFSFDQVANKWTSRSNIVPYSKFGVERHQRNPILENKKYVSTDAKDQLPATSLQSVLFLGEFLDGTHAGRVFLQAPSSFSPRREPLFSNADDSNYMVRHVIEWRVMFGNQIADLSSTIIADVVRDAKTAGFTSQVRLVTPKWNNTRIPSANMEVKQHAANLMWKDIVYVAEVPGKEKTYMHLNQFETLKNATPKSDETFGRLRAKNRP